MPGGGRAGARVLVGRCYDLTETPPYGPWRRALRARYAGDPARRPCRRLRRRGARPVASQEALFAPVRDFLARWRRGARSSCSSMTCTGRTPPASTCSASSPARSRPRPSCSSPPIARTNDAPPPALPLLPLLVREARARLDLRPLDEATSRAGRRRYRARRRPTRSAWPPTCRPRGGQPLLPRRTAARARGGGALLRARRDGWALATSPRRPCPPSCGR